MCREETLSPAARARSTASLIAPCVETQPTSSTFASGGPYTLGTGSEAPKACHLFQIRFRESFDASGNGLMAKDEDRHIVFAGNVHRFDGGVKTILDIGWREHHARRIAVSAETSNVEIRLLDIGWHPRRGTAALN